MAGPFLFLSVISSRIIPCDSYRKFRVQTYIKREVFRDTATRTLKFFLGNLIIYINTQFCIDGILLYPMTFQLTVSLDNLSRRYFLSKNKIYFSL